MLNDLKALVVIVFLAGAVFRLARPVALAWMPEEAFRRRRNVWFALTIVAFLSPSFWIYAAFALLLLWWAARRDENPLALYALVTFAIPNVHFYIPGGIVQQLFDLSQYRILSLAIVIPAIARRGSAPPAGNAGRLHGADMVLIAFLLLQVALLMPYESITNTMRRTFLLGLDTFVVFYAFSRLDSRQRIADVLACFWLAGAVMAAVAIFEWGKGWLLYTGLARVWGDPNMFSWLMRGDSLRAQAAAGHSINLGYTLAVSLGAFLFVGSRSPRRLVQWLFIAMLCLGIYVSGSRGAWITAMLIGLLCAALRPGAARYLPKLLLLGGCVVLAMYLSPLKESLLDRLPFIGTADQDTIAYRQRLAEVSWALIRQNPLLGDPFVYLRMEELRQGQGIIDIVNGYLYTALFYGLSGLALLVSLFLICAIRAATALLRVRSLDADAGLLGASLLATLLATLVFFATAGGGPTLYIVLALATSFAACSRATPAPQPEPTDAWIASLSPAWKP